MKIRKAFRALRLKIKGAIWNLGNFFGRIKIKIKTFFNKYFNFKNLPFFKKRKAKKEEGYVVVKNALGIDPELNILYEVDLPFYYKQIDDELKLLKNDANSKERILELKAYRKMLPPTQAQRNKSEKITKEAKGLGQAFLYLWPALLLLAIFTFYPIVNAFVLVIYEGYSEIDGSITGFTLFGNFIQVLTDSNFIVPASHTGSSAMINTLVIVFTTVPISIVVALLISVLLNSIKPFQKIFQTIFFLPYVTNSLAVGLVFAYMFRTDGGLVNQFLSVFGIQGGAWVTGSAATYTKAMFVLVLFSIWNGLAFKIMVFMSAIQGIDKQYYQAASIDATPRFKQFRRITAPLISPTILYIVITSVIGAFKTYSSVIAIFGNKGQPAGATYNLKTIVFYIYDFFNTTGKFSQAAAASIILFVIILIMTIIQMQVSKKRVHY